MASFTVWKGADEPNYNTNIDRVYPYSDLPHQGEYKLVKIPVSLNDHIEHVDYWGEGRVVSMGGISGFPNCYNVNHQYRLVSSGPDIDKKIPNRIPVLSYTDCDTSAYIKDNSVLTVTVSGSHINSSCAKDIARIVNYDQGKVVVYGMQSVAQDISDLVHELRKKGLFAHKNATLPRELQGLTYFDSHVAFLKINDIRPLKDELYNDVIKGNYDSAVSMSITFTIASAGKAIDEIVKKLLSSAPRNLMSYAYKLWHSGAKDIVRNHFPDLFEQIISEGPVTIVNKMYEQALKLESKNDPINKEKAIWGDKRLPKTSRMLSWKFVPSYNGNDLTFELYNIDCKMFMRMSDSVDYAGDRQCWGSTKNEGNSNDGRYKYYLEPLIGRDANLVFIIINRHHKQGLKLEKKRDSFGDRLLWGHNAPYFGDNIHDENDRYRWVIAPWSSCQ